MYVIRSQRMAAYLMGQGFKLIKIDVCKTNPNLNVFLFKDTIKLRQAMNEFNK